MGQEYGIDRIRTQMAQLKSQAPHALISTCIEDWVNFGEGLKQTDDLTLLVMRRQEGAREARLQA